MPRVVVVIVVVQASCVLLGFFALGFMLKMYGYPDNEAVRWHADAVFLRSYGGWGILMPFFWGTYALVAYQRDRGWLSFDASLVVGALLTIVTALAFVFAAVDSFTVPLLILNPK